jgi:hypothetical protein
MKLRRMSTSRWAFAPQHWASAEKAGPRPQPVFVTSGISIRLLMKMPGTQALRRAGTD